MHVLVTGGAGYLGSHTCVSLLEQGHDVTVVDNGSNGSFQSLREVEAITGRQIAFEQLDLLEAAATERLFKQHDFDAVVHLASLKSPGESVANPLRYYRANLGAATNLLNAMQKADVRTMVFSSSATVYGEPETVPVTESSAVSPLNPYGHTKLMIERILQDLAASDSTWRIASLRYFNPIGAHPSGRIGEQPSGVPANLFPYIAQVAVGVRPHLDIFGTDYPTPDGTCIRDYIHVMDLAEGHVRALDYLASSSGAVTVNLGTGRGTSVFEAIAAFEAACGRRLPTRIAARRPGDAAIVYADPTLARELFGWSSRLSVGQACEDAWRWQSLHPNGYAER
jgi:UDP-glucose 4-epimerase